MSIQEIYQKIGADYPDVISKFGKDEKVARYLQILLKSTAVEELGEAIAANDAEAAFAAAHNLKGTTGNMSLGRMASLFSQITEDARGGAISEGSRQAFAEAKGLYDTLASEIAAL